MANGRTRYSSRKADRWAIYDGLPPPIRAALQEGPQAWDVYNIRTFFNKAMKVGSYKQAVDRTVAMVNKVNQYEIERAMPYNGKSPHLAAQATMQLSNREWY